jgi:hypothetical protein
LVFDKPREQPGSAENAGGARNVVSGCRINGLWSSEDDRDVLVSATDTGRSQGPV